MYLMTKSLKSENTIAKVQTPIVFADFDHILKHLGIVLEILSLNTLLKIFKKSSIVNLTTEALKPLLLLINRYRSRRLYFRDYICRLRSRFKALRSRFRDFVIKYIIEDL